MIEFLNALIFRIKNIYIVISKDLEKLLNENFLLVAVYIALTFGIFYFISRWFKAYIIRLIIFLISSYILWDTLARSSILFSIDFYGSLGLLVPQLEIPQITYLILKYRTIYIYEKIKELILFISTPFVWLYSKIILLKDYFKAKQYSKSGKKNNQKNHYQEAKQTFNNKNKKTNYKQKQQQKEPKEKYKQEVKKEVNRWDSNDPYIVLGIEKTATLKEIKKAYRNLSKIYHPDLTLTDKKRNEEIFKKINWAYIQLKNK